MRRAPGKIRDCIVDYLSTRVEPATTAEIHGAVTRRVGAVPPSSVRSYLNLNTPRVFERVGRGRYRIHATGFAEERSAFASPMPSFSFGNASLVRADCFDWLAARQPHSIQAVVTDLPYGIVEYSEKEQQKLRRGRGGVWRIPPSFDGHVRSPLPRFTVLGDKEKEDLRAFFVRLGIQLYRVTVPGAHAVIASNSLFAPIVALALVDAGFEYRGSIARLVMTMRGGDRPKNAHREFTDVSVMPRSMWEPWVVVRHPLEGRVQDNLRKWKTGGLRRVSRDKPFGDVIKSAPTSSAERKIAPHPSLKPQSFMRQVVRAVLPLGRGVLLDPFAGSGSTLAAANAIGYSSIGVEADQHFFDLAISAIPKLGSLPS